MDSIRLKIYNQRTMRSIVNDTYRGPDCGERLLRKHGYMHTVKCLHLSLCEDPGKNEVEQVMGDIAYTLTKNIP